MNRLASEHSPYLGQHADNPVDWYPWGEAAFLRAAAEDKPLFISIGYATCHWCHVMAHESFENTEVAELLNRDFIAVKIDREELPHIDDYYMTALQILNGGGGGWPLTIFATPDKQAFIAATYLPRESRGGYPGLLELLPRVNGLWRDERERVEQTAAAVTARLAGTGDTIAGELLPQPEIETALTTVAEQAESSLERNYDRQYGGFGTAPKFPSFHTLIFLLRRHSQTGRKVLLDMVEETAASMRAGGIYDQVGFGIHRYATDAEWKLPHFEKMLYDQAGLIMLCGELHLITGRPRYRKIITETAEYLLRDLRAPEGAFYSAEDADSEGEEGRFYLWGMDELKELLTPPDLDELTKAFELRHAGNFRHETGGASEGGNILHANPRPAEELPSPISDLLRNRLLSHREKRPRPFRDTKIMTDWNGFLIAALAKAGRALQDESLIRIAGEAMGFLTSTLMSNTADGPVLHHRYCGGDVQQEAFLDDYAYFIMASLELFLSTFKPKYLSTALALQKRVETEFAHPDGGYTLAAGPQEEVGTRSRPLFDGAYPSGNSVMLDNLTRLYRLTGDPKIETACLKTLQAILPRMREHPAALLHALTAAGDSGFSGCEIVVAGDPGNEETKLLLEKLQQLYLPDSLVILRPPGDADITSLLPYTAAMQPAAGRPSVYICRNRVCRRPVTEWEDILRNLGTPLQQPLQDE